MSKTFKELGVSPKLIKGLEELGIHTPTRIQEEAIPFLMESNGDLIAQQAPQRLPRNPAGGQEQQTRLDKCSNALDLGVTVVVLVISRAVGPADGVAVHCRIIKRGYLYG